jgi:tRNA (guanine37-N1)-methyltransferase
MHIDVLTLFPAMFKGPLTESILGRATAEEKGAKNLCTVSLHDLRQWGIGRYKQVDDRPYGGGAGMVMRVDVLSKAIEEIRDDEKKGKGKPWRISFSPRGKRLTQRRVEQLSRKPRLLLVCGHYEGIDQRLVDGGWIDEELRIGDYVLTGGELPAMVLIDAVARQIPGVLGKDASAHEESFSSALGRKREYPHYTRPEEFAGMRVPSVLLSGNHAAVATWRQEHLC